MVGHILVASSIPTHRIFLAAVFRAASYRVTEAGDAAEMLQCCAALCPDLVVLHPAAGEKAWVDAMSDLAARQGATLPVLMIDAEDSPASRLFYLSAGAAETVSAPINQVILRARVRNLLRARGLMAEARERLNTALELGLAEAPAQFLAPARIVIADHEGHGPASLLSAVRACRNSRSEIVASRDILTRVMSGRAPDLVVLPPKMMQDQSALTMIAELRSHSSTRNVSILLVHDADDRLSAVSALDLGANDVAEATSSADELTLRMRVLTAQKREADNMRENIHKGLELAATDPLTGLFNRRYALTHLNRISAGAAQSGKPFAVLILDLDWFKRVNDLHGHAVGDQVLASVGQRLQDNVRAADLVARIGGEEFLVIMPDTDLENARSGAERLRQVIATEAIKLRSHGKPIRITASIGIAVGSGQPSQPAESLIERADKALYAAKSHGRNVVEAGQFAA